LQAAPKNITYKVHVVELLCYYFCKYMGNILYDACIYNAL